MICFEFNSNLHVKHRNAGTGVLTTNTEKPKITQIMLKRLFKYSELAALQAAMYIKTRKGKLIEKFYKI